MGHLSHGGLRALGSHVLRYGLRTISGRTGGVRMDVADDTAASEASRTDNRSSIAGFGAGAEEYFYQDVAESMSKARLKRGISLILSSCDLGAPSNI
jgi:hypothetical protein